MHVLASHACDNSGAVFSLKKGLWTFNFFISSFAEKNSLLATIAKCRYALHSCDNYNAAVYPVRLFRITDHVLYCYTAVLCMWDMGGRCAYPYHGEHTASWQTHAPIIHPRSRRWNKDVRCARWGGSAAQHVQSARQLQPSRPDKCHKIDPAKHGPHAQSTFRICTYIVSTEVWQTSALLGNLPLMQPRLSTNIYTCVCVCVCMVIYSFVDGPTNWFLSRRRDRAN